MTIALTCPAFADEGMIPAEYTCDGSDRSPELSWGAAPDGTAGFALIADDPDAPKGTWVHWVIYNIPAGAQGLPGSVPKSARLGDGSLQGLNDWGRSGYGGPCPPSGTHRYFFKVYALDMMLGIGPGATKGELVSAMRGHIIAEGQLMGRYKRG